ncbi:MAG TPA: tetratricopeptide repeat protein [Blastocatellia bacterium]|nr:tetratricopeptide repeat protein [Blastocatellia bacterium]
MITIPLGPLPVRIIFLVSLLAGLSILGWGAVRSAVSDLLMTFVVPSPRLSLEEQVEWADTALNYSPRDPLIRWKHGGVYLKAANEKMDESWRQTAIEELRAAARMSPDDYRVWLALGRAIDRGGDISGARAAFERAIDLAPNHFDPRWAFGNYLLRAGDREGSFAQMRLALSNRPSALPLIFDYAWGVYRGDGKAIAAALDAPRLARLLRAQLAALLIYRGRVGAGMEVWQEITTPSAGDAEKVTEALFNTGNFNKSFEVWNSVEIPNRPTPDQDSLLSNGGFEGDLSRGLKTPFLTWQINSVPGAKILQDRKEPRDGRRSLRAGFDVRGNQSFIIASQTVPAKPSTTYRLAFSIRADKLLSLSNPLVEVFDSAYVLDQRNRIRAAAPPLPNGDSEWTDYKLEFTTGAQTEAVTVRIARPSCSEPPCPIEGHIWFDEFKLTEKGK